MHPKNTSRRISAHEIAEDFARISGPQHPANEAVRKTQIEQQMTEIDCAVNRLEAITDAIIKRLESVTSKSPETDSVNPATPEPMLVPLADKMRGQQYRINLACERLERLIPQIEL